MDAEHRRASPWVADSLAKWWGGGFGDLLCPLASTLSGR